MLINVGKTSCGDFGEESLVGRFLLALILNEYSVVNSPPADAFRDFARRCLNLELSPDEIKRGTATVEFQPNRCATGGDKTTFDALLTLEDQWVWGIEAKYFDVLKVEQVEREVAAIEALARHLNYPNAGLLFITPEQQLGTHVTDRGEVYECLSARARNDRPAIRFASWEMIFDILISTGPPTLREELEEYCRLRNENPKSPKLATAPRIPTTCEWRNYFIGQAEPPADLPVLAGASSGFERYGKASSTVQAVFGGRYLKLAEQIIRLSQLEPLAQKSDYVNLSRRSKAYGQLHPHPDGVALAVRGIDAYFPKCPSLLPIPIHELHGYKVRNISWLKRAGAFLLPCRLESSPTDPAWNEVKALLTYTVSR